MKPGLLLGHGWMAGFASAFMFIGVVEGFAGLVALCAAVLGVTALSLYLNSPYAR